MANTPIKVLKYVSYSIASGNKAGLQAILKFVIWMILVHNNSNVNSI